MTPCSGAAKCTGKEPRLGGRALGSWPGSTTSQLPKLRMICFSPVLLLHFSIEGSDIGTIQITYGGGPCIPLWASWLADDQSSYRWLQGSFTGIPSPEFCSADVATSGLPFTLKVSSYRAELDNTSQLPRVSPCCLSERMEFVSPSAI